MYRVFISAILLTISICGYAADPSKALWVDLTTFESTTPGDFYSYEEALLTGFTAKDDRTARTMVFQRKGDQIPAKMFSLAIQPFNGFQSILITADEPCILGDVNLDAQIIVEKESVKVLSICDENVNGKATMAYVADTRFSRDIMVEQFKGNDIVFVSLNTMLVPFYASDFNLAW